MEDKAKHEPMCMSRAFSASHEYECTCGVGPTVSTEDKASKLARLTPDERIQLFTIMQQWSRNADVQAQKITDWFEQRVAALLRPLLGEQRWIPVEERLPDAIGQYLVWVYGLGDEGEMCKVTMEACFDQKNWFMHGGWLSHEVQGWQPLPAPPAEEGK